MLPDAPGPKRVQSRFLVLFWSVSWLAGLFPAAAAQSSAPYPRSEQFKGITFDHTTLQHAASGSDIWSCTWADDGKVYACWGDGGGFGGTDTNGRVSLGVARISGAPPGWQAINVWGGLNPVSTQTPAEGKATLIAANHALYLYTSRQGTWDQCHLWKSSDYGRTWANRGSIFPHSHKIFAFPGLVQFGRDNELSRDGFVYGLSDNDPRRGQDGRLYLFRVKADHLEDLRAYEYFSGTSGPASIPRWSARLEEIQPVFANPAGIGWGTTCVFHPATGRFLLAVSTHANRGDWGLYESPRLWGPWRTVGYGADFPTWTYAPAAKNRPAYLHSFPAKWIGADGKTLWCVFDRGDQFNLVRCSLDF